MVFKIPQKVFSTQSTPSSSLIPPISSKKLPPPLVGAPKKVSETPKKNTFLVTPGLHDPPVLISNSEIFVIIKSLERQVAQQQEDNTTILKEVERMST